MMHLKFEIILFASKKEGFELLQRAIRKTVLVSALPLNGSRERSMERHFARYFGIATIRFQDSNSKSRENNILKYIFP